MAEKFWRMGNLSNLPQTFLPPKLLTTYTVVDTTLQEVTNEENEDDDELNIKEQVTSAGSQGSMKNSSHS